MEKDKGARADLIRTALFSLALGMAVSLTMGLHYVRISSGPEENFLGADRITLLRGLALALPAFGAVYGLGRAARKRFPASRVRLPGRALFPAVWGLLILCWAPYLLTFYPGGVVGDGAEALEYAIRPETMDARWGAAFILALRAFLALGRVFSPDVNTGIFLYAAWSLLMYSGACAFIVTALAKKGVPPLGVAAAALLYAVSGHYGSFAVALWKDGLFGAGTAVLSVLLWNEAEAERGSAGRRAGIGAVLVFLCLWRNMICWAAAAAGTLLLRGFRGEKRKTALVILAVGILMILVQGPGYALLGFTGTGAAETLALPIQQVGAALRDGAEVSEEQGAVLFSLLPRERWTALYSPTLSDKLKFAMDDGLLREKKGDFLRVWLQLMPGNLRSYGRAFLMETLGFWQPYGSNRGNYYDGFIGIQDLYGRGYRNRDLIYEAFGRTMENALKRRTAFLSSGAAVWVLLLSTLLVLGQRPARRRKLAALVPGLLCWAVTLCFTPIAYSWRYVEALAVGLPVYACLPWIRETPARAGEEAAAADRPDTKKVPGLRIAAAAAAAAVLITLSGLRGRFPGGRMTIETYGENDHTLYYVTRGLSVNEGTYRWTDGEELEVRVPYRERQENLEAVIHVQGTFNGSQRYQAAGAAGEILAEGELAGAGEIRFPVRGSDGEVAFVLRMPDAAVISEVIPGSGDHRRVAFRIDRIDLIQAEGPR